jgi:hypothetical protein
MRPREIRLQPVEQGFTPPISRWAKAWQIGHVQLATAPLAGNDANLSGAQACLLRLAGPIAGFTAPNGLTSCHVSSLVVARMKPNPHLSIMMRGPATPVQSA